MRKFYGLPGLGNRITGLLRVTENDDGAPMLIEVYNRTSGDWFEDRSQVKYLVPGEDRAIPLDEDQADAILRGDTVEV
jgi:hypothetical protein